MNANLYIKNTNEGESLPIHVAMQKLTKIITSESHLVQFSGADPGI
jgi:hypothetical protein